MNITGNRWTKKNKCSIIFDGVWERQPKMLDTVKTYLQWLLLGKMGKKRVWRTAGTYKEYLENIATFLEKNNRTSFADVTPELLRRWWSGSKQAESNRATIELMVRMCSCRGLPHLPRNPLQNLHLPTFVVVKKVKQTEAIDDVLWVKVLQRALAYEEDAHRLADWLRDKDWNSPWAMERGIEGPRTLQRYVWEVRMAGAVLVLAFTGMRKSELVALRTGALECIQRERPYWVIWGTVFKFFGEGERARWACGEIGRRGYAMLTGCAEESGCLFPNWLGNRVGEPNSVVVENAEIRR
jgi:site-specific recombinase XerD